MHISMHRAFRRTSSFIVFPTLRVRNETMHGGLGLVFFLCELANGVSICHR
jgi:hypothetical protein